MAEITVPTQLSKLSHSQVERLLHIDFRLFFLGELRRADLTGRFGTGPAGATRDIALYKTLAPENLEFDGGDKLYVPSPGFKPLFEHSPQRALVALSKGFGESVDGEAHPLVRCEFPDDLSTPKADVLAPITRAIHRGKAVRLAYISGTSGASERDIVPLALVDSGVRWHVRAYDRKSGDFRDFVLTRMKSSAVIEDSEVLPKERAESDTQWSRVIDLELVPHPAHERPEMIELDYGMAGGCLRLKARAATVGYMLRRWNVDCSPDHSLRGKEYMLWLRDPLALYGAESALLAPGYSDPRAVGLAKSSESSTNVRGDAMLGNHVKDSARD